VLLLTLKKPFGEELLGPVTHAVQHLRALQRRARDEPQVRTCRTHLGFITFGTRPW
jgi:hypothetical protein